MIFRSLFLALAALIAPLTFFAQLPNPILTGSLKGPAGGIQLDGPRKACVSGNFAYVINLNTYATAGGSLEIIDISNPSNPVHASGLSYIQNSAILGSPTDIFIAGNYAYITNRQGSLDIIDISNPSIPLPVSQIAHGISGAFLSGANSVAIAGNYAYVGGGLGLGVIDITVPGAPVPKGSLQLPNGAQHILVSGNYAYVLAPDNLRVIDISNPYQPVLVGALSDGQGGALLGDPTDIAISGNFAFITSASSNALEVVNLLDPTAPIHAGSLSYSINNVELSAPSSIFISGSQAFVTSAGTDALEVVNISSPTSPTHEGKLTSTLGDPFRDPDFVWVAGTNAYVVNNVTNTIQIVDVSTPANPQLLKTVNDGAGGAQLNTLSDIDISGSRAYISTDDGIEVTDISNGQPKHISFILNGDNGASLHGCTSVEVAGNLLFATSTADNTLEIMDITDPDHPKHLSKISDGDGGAVLGAPVDVKIQGNYAYVAVNNQNAIEIIDISHPLSPVHKSTITDGDGGAHLSRPYSIFLSGNYAYVASYMSNALEIIDITNPVTPVHAASVVDGTNGAQLNSPSAVYVSNGFAYVVANGNGQLEVINVQDPSAPFHVATADIYSSIPAYGTRHAITGTGQYCFVADVNRDVIQIFDVSNPSLPNMIISAKGEGSNGYSVAVSGNFAYLLYDASLDAFALFTPPAPVAMQASDVLSSSFIANWNPLPYANYNGTTYLVDVSSDNFQTFVPGYNGAASFGAFLDIAGLQPQTQYQYRVRATNAGGTSAGSNTIVLITAPPQPKVSAHQITQTSLIVYWDPIPGVTNYLFGGAATDGSATVQPTELVFVDSVQLTGLQPGKQYGFNVTSTNSFANSYPSGFIVTTIPADPTALAITSPAQHSFVANWTLVDGVTKYLMDVSTDNFSTFVVHDLEAPVYPGAFTFLTNIDAGTLYQFRVRAANDAGASGYSNVQSVVTIPPTPVAGPLDPVSSDTTLIARWTSCKSATSYQIDGVFYKASTYYVFSFTVDDGTATSVILPLSRKKVYYYTVAAINASGESPRSNQVEVITGLSSSEPIQVYPNPVESSLIVSLPAGGTADPAMLTIVDAFGRPVFYESIVTGINASINVSSLSSGLYVLEMTQGGIIYRGKFIRK